MSVRRRVRRLEQRLGLDTGQALTAEELVIWKIEHGRATEEDWEVVRRRERPFVVEAVMKAGRTYQLARPLGLRPRSWGPASWVGEVISYPSRDEVPNSVRQDVSEWRRLVPATRENCDEEFWLFYWRRQLVLPLIDDPADEEELRQQLATAPPTLDWVPDRFNCDNDPIARRTMQKSGHERPSPDTPESP